MEKIGITVEGLPENNGNAEIGDFLKIAEGVITLLKKIAQREQGKEKAHKKTKDYKFLLVNLSHSSPARIDIGIAPATAGARPLSLISDMEKFFSRVSEGNTDSIPDEFLAAGESIAGPIRRKGIKAGIQFPKAVPPDSSAAVDEQFVRNIQQARDQEICDYSTVEGRVEMLNLHGKPRLQIYSDLPGVPSLVCVFSDPEIERKAIEAIKHRVAVRGQAWYRPHSFHPHRMHLEGIDLLDDGDCPRAADLKGAFPRITGDLTIAEHIAKIHDEW